MTVIGMDWPGGVPPIDESATRTSGATEMSLRDWFAGQALNAAIAIHLYSHDPEQIARFSYLIADAMMEAARKK